MPVTEAVFLKDDPFREIRCPFAIERNLHRFLSINGAAFNQLCIIDDRLGLKLKLANEGLTSSSPVP